VRVSEGAGGVAWAAAIRQSGVDASALRGRCGYLGRMSIHSDLSPCTSVLDSPQVLAVGWLGRSVLYNRGPVDGAFFEKLFELLLNPWQPAVSLGIHRCELCRFTGAMTNLFYRNQSVQDATGLLVVPGDGVLYVAPTRVAHYVDAHEYAPPPAFVAAVMACPEMRSMPYLRALMKNGPKGFVKAGAS